MNVTHEQMLSTGHLVKKARQAEIDLGFEVGGIGGVLQEAQCPLGGVHGVRVPWVLATSRRTESRRELIGKASENAVTPSQRAARQ